jgi:antitoxin CptB
MRELDVLLLRYLEQEYPSAAAAEREAFGRILELQDPELFGYLVGRTTPEDEAVRHVIARIRRDR